MNTSRSLRVALLTLAVISALLVLGLQFAVSLVSAGGLLALLWLDYGRNPRPLAAVSARVLAFPPPETFKLAA